MIPYEETRRTAGQGSFKRASEMFRGRDTLEVEQTLPIFNLQAARIARQFAVSDAVARLIAEHAYAARPAR